MDKSVPAAAAKILDFISGPESGGNYKAISSYKQDLLPKAITSMTVNELLKEMQTWRKKYKTLSSAAGRYQIIYKTLLNLKDVMGLKGTEKFDPDMQDRMGLQLLRYRGYEAFMAGKIDVKNFGKQLAQEWASMPVLEGTKNYKGVNIKRGSSYYAGDGLNSHGTSAAALERILIAASGEKTPVKAFDLEHTLNDVQSNLPAAVNVKVADSPIAAATKIGTSIAAGAAVVGGAADATKSVTDWSPIIELVSTISKWGPTVAGIIVAGVVIAVISRKLFKG